VIDQQWSRVTVEGVEVAASEITLRVDDTWSPMWEASITLTAAEDDAPDPREGDSITVEMFQRFGAFALTLDLSAMFGGGLTSAISAVWGGLLTSDISNLPGRAWNASFVEGSGITATLRVSRRRARADGTVEITAESGEKPLHEVKWPDVQPSATTVRSFLELLEESFGITLEVAAGTLDLDLITDDNGTVTPGLGQSPFDYLTPVLLQGYARLWSDEGGLLHLDSSNDPDPASADQVLNRDATMQEADINRDDDLWFDGVIVEFDPRPTGYLGGQPHVFFKGDATATKVKHLRYNVQAPETSSSGYEPVLDDLIARAARRSRAVPVTALNDFSLRPHRSIHLESPPFAPNHNGIVQRIEWRTRDGEMDITLRSLEAA
jgi:hypothetical protein